MPEPVNEAELVKKEEILDARMEYGHLISSYMSLANMFWLGYGAFFYNQFAACDSTRNFLFAECSIHEFDVPLADSYSDSGDGNIYFGLRDLRFDSDRQNATSD